MIVFKTFLKVLKSYRVPVLLYTVLLVVFGTVNMESSDHSIDFVDSQPHIFIINHDEDVGITKSLISYLSKNCHIEDIKNEQNAINDALFYRDVSYIIIIPENYRMDILNHRSPTIEIKSSGDYEATYAQMLLERYTNTLTKYNHVYDQESDIIRETEKTMNQKVEVEMTSKIDTTQISNATVFFNFANYSLLAGCVYVVCLVLSSFRNENIHKRTVISSIDIKKYNRELLLSNGLFVFVLWLVYIILSLFLVGDIMLTKYGMVYILNSFLFAICSLTIGFLIAHLTSHKEAMNGIVNVVSLGSSFLCGAFVPMSLLPDFVLGIAHILPSYWYIKTNELLKTIDVINLGTLRPIFMNMLIMIGFIVGFIILTNIISYKKRQIA